MNIAIKKINPEARIPVYAHEGDAGADLFSVETVLLEPGIPTRVPTGIICEIPQGYVGLIWDKSGLSFNHGLKTLGGVIDASFRGEIVIGLINLKSAPYTIEKGDKVAQLLLQPVQQAFFKEEVSLSNTTRNTDGWGSTGK